MSSIANVYKYISISVSGWHPHDTLHMSWHVVLTHQSPPASLERDPKALCEEPGGRAKF